MKNLFFILIFSAFPLFSFGGGIKFNLQGGLGSYAMNDMKALNNMAIAAIPLPVRLTDNFPVYWYYQGSIQFCITKNLELGPMYAYHSTGSRASLADYSGEYYFDNLIHAHQLGLAIDYKLCSQNNLAFSIYTDAGIGFTKLKVNELLKLTEAEEISHENLNFASAGYFAEPGVRLSYVIKFLEPGIQFGYYIPITEKGLKNAGNKTGLYFQDGTGVRAGWNGIRAGLSLGIYLTGK